MEKCQEEKLDAYIPDLKFRNRDSRFATRPKNRPKKSKKYVLEDFKHNEVEDCYICPNGKILKLALKKIKTLGNQPVIKQKKKVSDFLIRRGFDWDMVREILNDLIDEKVD